MWSFVKRSWNKVAHVLAYLWRMEVGKHYWGDEFSDSIVCLVSNDLIL